MKTPFLFLILAISITDCDSPKKSGMPEFMTGTFHDDYDIEYEIAEELWFQKPNAKFHVVKWDTTNKYLIAKNDSTNPSEPGLFTRFDWMKFEDMEPFEWGFCMTIYNASSMEEAEQISPPDREHPKEGCNGFPFSRMQRMNHNQQ